jgi:4-hydroxyacetophenone monooxygenase
VVEKNPTVGGTWWENRYPGCRVDVANHFYCYSFEPSHDWSEFFSQRDELQAYFERTTDRHGLRARIRFETEVVGARWDEAAARWQVRLRTQDGREETLAANAIVSAVGQLNRPRLPDLPGRERFRGASFHSAQWDASQDLRGKRVAVIGTGASAFQLVPEVAKQAAQLTVFQRSAPWMIPNPVYHARVGEGKKWLLRHVPAYARWYRFLLFWPGSDGLLPSLVIDPSWPHPERSVNALNEEQRKGLTAWYAAQLEGRPDLLAKVVPDYPPFGKRILQDDGTWLAALRRENVELVTAGIREITEDAVVDEEGRAHPADVIVYATGFHANRFLWPMEIVGRGGRLLSERFGEEPRAYLGITVPGFPNLFCLYGPATNLAHAGSIIFHSECQVRYAMGCVKALVENGWRALDCREDVHDAFNARLDAALAKLVWSHPGMNSWYKNRRGKVTTTSPWRLVDYWRWTREPDLADYHVA